MSANSVRDLMRMADPLPVDLRDGDAAELEHELAVLMTRLDEPATEIGIFRIADHPVSRRRRRALVAVAAAAAVIAAGSAVALERMGDQHSAAPGGMGVTAPPDIIGATVTLENRRDLAVAVELAGPVPCAIDDAHVRVVAQGTHSVAIAVSGFTLSTNPMNCEIGSGTTLALRLTTPLGQRQLIDSATGQPVPVIDGRIVPTPTYLPPGYTLLHAGVDGVPSGGGGLRVPMAARNYSKNGGEGGIDVYAARSQVARGPGWTVDPGAYAVDGHRATLTTGAHERCLTWTVSANRSLQVCNDVAFTPTRDYGNGNVDGPNVAPLLSAAELVRIARGLH